MIARRHWWPAVEWLHDMRFNCMLMPEGVVLGLVRFWKAQVAPAAAVTA